MPMNFNTQIVRSSGADVSEKLNELMKQKGITSENYDVYCEGAKQNVKKANTQMNISIYTIFFRFAYSSVVVCEM